MALIDDIDDNLNGRCWSVVVERCRDLKSQAQREAMHGLVIRVEGHNTRCLVEGNQTCVNLSVDWILQGCLDRAERVSLDQLRSDH